MTAKNCALLVEDSPTVLTVVKYFLELEGFEVLTACDGEAGLEMARREIPDVVVTDLRMPGLDGMDLIRELRASESTRQIAIIILTSDDRVDTEEHCLALGADDYMMKPVEPRRLAARIKALLSRSEGRASLHSAA